PAITEVLQRPEYRQSHWGFLFTDVATGQDLYELNADKLFAPASVTKVFSCSSALNAFGSDYRFVTTVHRRGNVATNGELMGDLVLVASGDLTLGGRNQPNGKLRLKN